MEPIVRRTLRTTTDEQVRTLSTPPAADRLRHRAADGVHRRGDRREGVHRPPVYIQAQLASLLREVGLTAEAKQEGEAALALLAQHAAADDGRPSVAAHVPGLARAHEGAGHDAEALKWYGKFVEFGSQFQQPKMCAGCHTTMGPRDMVVLPGLVCRPQVRRVRREDRTRRRADCDARDRAQARSGQPRVESEPGVPVRGDWRDEAGPGSLGRLIVAAD